MLTRYLLVMPTDHWTHLDSNAYSFCTAYNNRTVNNLLATALFVRLPIFDSVRRDIIKKSMVKKETRIIKNYSNNAYLQEQGNYEPRTETNKPYKTARSPFLFPTKGSGQWSITRVKLTLRVRKMQVTFHCNIRYLAAVGLESNRSCQLL